MSMLKKLLGFKTFTAIVIGQNSMIFKDQMILDKDDKTYKLKLRKDVIGEISNEYIKTDNRGNRTILLYEYKKGTYSIIKSLTDKGAEYATPNLTNVAIRELQTHGTNVQTESFFIKNFGQIALVVSGMFFVYGAIQFSKGAAGYSGALIAMADRLSELIEVMKNAPL